MPYCRVRVCGAEKVAAPERLVYTAADLDDGYGAKEVKDLVVLV